MDLSEILFLGGFIVFISAILLLDMFVIDKKAHVVSIKEAGTWTAVWIALALLFSVFLWFHGDMVHGIENFSDLQTVASRYAAHLKLDPNDFEASLQEYQHVLNWGILGAIVLRFVFIFLGAAIISRFDWVLLVFGAVLVYSGVKMYLNRNKKEEMDVEKHPLVRLLSKTGRIHTQFEGDKFFIQRPHLCLRQHPGGILRVARPVCGVLLQHLRHPRPACHVLPVGSHSRQVPLSEAWSVCASGVYRSEDAHP